MMKIFYKNTKLTTLLMLLLFGGTSCFSQNFDKIIKAVASDRGANDRFGTSVAISGNYAIVGASAESEDVLGGNTLSDAGSAYIFERNTAGIWVEKQKIVASDRGISDRFGSVAISGNYVVVGAYSDGEDASGGNTLYGAGSAYIFERNTTGVWVEKQKIVASDRGTYDFFGVSVAISGNYIVVGAGREDEDVSGGNTLSDAGSAYVFERNTTGVWVEKQKIVASDRGFGDNFGASVSISGNYVVIGAYLEDEDALGMNTLNNPGSAYIFERNASGVWAEKQKIVASDRGADDRFGISVAVSGNYVVVGADSEDEDALGMNTLSKAGSAYIFERNTSGVWAEKQKIVASDRGTSDFFGGVAISGNYIIVEAYLEDEDTLGTNTLHNSGSAYIFERNASGVWAEKQKIVANDRGVQDNFGSSVAISGNYAIVGAFTEDEDVLGGNTLSDAGSVYIFEPFVCATTVSSFTTTECTSYTVPSGDETYSTVGTSIVQDTIPNSCGADSIMTISVTILAPLTGVQNDTVCFGGSIVVNGTTYDASNLTGTEVFSNIGANNCDSTVTVNLTINTIDKTITIINDTIIANEIGSNYQWIDCATNTYIIGETNFFYVASNPGNYAVEITNNSCMDTSNCVTITGIQSSLFSNKTIKLYPNPTTRDITFEIDINELFNYSLTAVSGKLIVKEENVAKNNVHIDLSKEKKGVYLLKVYNNKNISFHKIIKQ